MNPNTHIKLLYELITTPTRITPTIRPKKREDSSPPSYPLFFYSLFFLTSKMEQITAISPVTNANIVVVPVCGNSASFFDEVDELLFSDVLPSLCLLLVSLDEVLDDEADELELLDCFFLSSTVTFAVLVTISLSLIS